MQSIPPRHTLPFLACTAASSPVHDYAWRPPPFLPSLQHTNESPPSPCRFPLLPTCHSTTLHIASPLHASSVHGKSLTIEGASGYFQQSLVASVGCQSGSMPLWPTPSMAPISPCGSSSTSQFYSCTFSFFHGVALFSDDHLLFPQVGAALYSVLGMEPLSSTLCAVPSSCTPSLHIGL